MNKSKLQQIIREMIESVLAEEESVVTTTELKRLMDIHASNINLFKDLLKKAKTKEDRESIRTILRNEENSFKAVHGVFKQRTQGR